MTNDSLQSLHNGEPEAPPDAFARCVDRLETIIRAETQILRRGGKIDFEALNLRKSHALLEFLRVSKSSTAQSAGRSAERVKTLQKLLADNAALLERRLQATDEVASLIVRHLRDSESDGTYSSFA